MVRVMTHMVHTTPVTHVSVAASQVDMHPTHVSPGFLQWSDDWRSLSTKFAAVNAGEHHFEKLGVIVEL